MCREETSEDVEVDVQESNDTARNNEENAVVSCCGKEAWAQRARRAEDEHIVLGIIRPPKEDGYQVSGSAPPVHLPCYVLNACSAFDISI